MKTTLPLLTILIASMAMAQAPTMLFDFRHKNVNGWKGNFHVKLVEGLEEGLHAVSNGGADPWIEGPAIPQLPEGDYDKIKLEIRFKCSYPSIQIFWGPGFSAMREASFSNRKPNEWTTGTVIIPRLHAGDRLRIDPCMYDGDITVATIRAIPLIKLYSPVFSKPSPVAATPNDVMLQSGSLSIRHHPCQWDAFTVMNGDELLASSHTQSQIALVIDGKTQTFNLSEAKTTAELQGNSLVATAFFTDTNGAHWTTRRTFTPLPRNAVRIDTSFTADQDRLVAHIPYLTLFPGLGSFAAHKTQALLPGVEYLVDEPSSNDKDADARTANRVIVSDHKLCFPLMAISHGHQWLSLSWDYDKFPATIFDTPDRVFNSGAHLFALWGPGMQQGRQENDFCIYEALPGKAGKPLALTTTIVVGTGDGTMQAPLADYLTRHPLPPLPHFENGFQGALSLAAKGWLDSAIHIGAQWRHAYTAGTNFKPAYAGDALVQMSYIARKTTDKALAQRLNQCVEETFAQFPHLNYGNTVSHCYHNLYTYMFLNHTENWLAAIQGDATRRLASIRPDGSSRFLPAPPPKPNYGASHWADHANGLTANHLMGAARYALATGDQAIRRSVVEAIDKTLKLYHGDVPRGAQTWEIPLHTPDILGSAYMLGLCTIAYHLTGDDKYRNMAEYWALTGIPFVYLEQPVPASNSDGLYGTIAVLGSTAWQAPSWFGLPVQWCGLVYRNFLYEYIDILKDPARQAFWKKVGDGITITGLQFSYQERDGDADDMIGLLPDSYRLKSRGKGGPSINPGTVQIQMPHAYNETPITNMKAFKTGVFIHALGGIVILSDHSAQLDLWPGKPTQVLISGLSRLPSRITWQGQDVSCKWLAERNLFIVTLQGKGELEWTE